MLPSARWEHRHGLLRMIEVAASPYAKWLRDESLERDLGYLRRYGEQEGTTERVDQAGLESPNSIPRHWHEATGDQEGQVPPAPTPVGMPSPQFFSCLKEMADVVATDVDLPSTAEGGIHNAVLSQSEERLRNFLAQTQRQSEQPAEFATDSAPLSAKRMLDYSPIPAHHSPTITLHQSRLRSPTRPSPFGQSAATIEKLRTLSPVLSGASGIAQNTDQLDPRPGSSYTSKDEEAFALIEDKVFRELLTKRLNEAQAASRNVSSATGSASATTEDHQNREAVSKRASTLSDTLAELATITAGGDKPSSNVIQRPRSGYNSYSKSDEDYLPLREPVSPHHSTVSGETAAAGIGLGIAVAEADYQLAVTPPRHLEAVLTHSRNHSFPSRGIHAATSSSSFGDSGAAMGSSAMRTSSIAVLVPMGPPEPIECSSFRTASNVSERHEAGTRTNSTRRALDMAEAGAGDAVRQLTNQKKDQTERDEQERSIIEMHKFAESTSPVDSTVSEFMATVAESGAKSASATVNDLGTRASGSGGGGGGVSLPPDDADLDSSQSSPFIAPVPSSGMLASPQRGVGRTATGGLTGSEERSPATRTLSISPRLLPTTDQVSTLEHQQPAAHIPAAGSVYTNVANQYLETSRMNTRAEPTVAEAGHQQVDLQAATTASAPRRHRMLTTAAIDVPRKSSAKTYGNPSSPQLAKTSHTRAHHSLLVQIRAAHLKEMLQLLRTESARRYQIEMELVQEGPSAADIGRRSLLRSSISPYHKSALHLRRSLAEEEREDRCLIHAEETTKILQLHRIHIEAVMQMQRRVDEDEEEVSKMERSMETDPMSAGLGYDGDDAVYGSEGMNSRGRSQSPRAAATSAQLREEDIQYEEEEDRYGLGEEERTWRRRLASAAADGEADVDAFAANLRAREHEGSRYRDKADQELDQFLKSEQLKRDLELESQIGKMNEKAKLEAELRLAVIELEALRQEEETYQRKCEVQLAALNFQEEDSRAAGLEAEISNRIKIERDAIMSKTLLRELQSDSMNRRRQLESEESEMRSTESYVESSRRLRLRLQEKEERDDVYTAEGRREQRRLREEAELLSEAQEREASVARKGLLRQMVSFDNSEVERRLEIEVDSLADFDQLLKLYRQGKMAVEEQEHAVSIQTASEMRKAAEAQIQNSDALSSRQKQLSLRSTLLNEEEEQQRALLVAEARHTFANLASTAEVTASALLQKETRMAVAFARESESLTTAEMNERFQIHGTALRDWDQIAIEMNQERVVLDLEMRTKRSSLDRQEAAVALAEARAVRLQQQAVAQIVALAEEEELGRGTLISLEHLRRDAIFRLFKVESEDANHQDELRKSAKLCALQKEESVQPAAVALKTSSPAATDEFLFAPTQVESPLRRSIQAEEERRSTPPSRNQSKPASFRFDPATEALLDSSRSSSSSPLLEGEHVATGTLIASRHPSQLQAQQTAATSTSLNGAHRISFTDVLQQADPHSNELLDFITMNNYTDEITDPTTVATPGSLVRGASSPLLSRYGSKAAVLMDFAQSGDTIAFHSSASPLIGREGNLMARGSFKQGLTNVNGPASQLPRFQQEEYNVREQGPLASDPQNSNSKLILTANPSNDSRPSRSATPTRTHNAVAIALQEGGYIDTADTPTSTVYCAGTPQPYYEGRHVDEGAYFSNPDGGFLPSFHVPLDFGTHHDDINEIDAAANDDEIVFGDGFEGEEEDNDAPPPATNSNRGTGNAKLRRKHHKQTEDRHQNDDEDALLGTQTVSSEGADDAHMIAKLSQILSSLSVNRQQNAHLNNGDYFGSTYSSRSGTPQSPYPSAFAEFDGTDVEEDEIVETIGKLLSKYRNRSAEVEKLRELLAFTVERKKGEAEELLREKSISASATRTSMVEAAMHQTNSTFVANRTVSSVGDASRGGESLHQRSPSRMGHNTSNVSAILEHHRSVSRAASSRAALTPNRVSTSQINSSIASRVQSATPMAKATINSSFGHVMSSTRLSHRGQPLQPRVSPGGVFSPYRSIHDLISPIKADEEELHLRGNASAVLPEAYYRHEKRPLAPSQPYHGTAARQQNGQMPTTRGSATNSRSGSTMIMNDVTARAIRNTLPSSATARRPSGDGNKSATQNMSRLVTASRESSKIGANAKN